MTKHQKEDKTLQRRRNIKDDETLQRMTKHYKEGETLQNDETLQR